MYILLVEVVKGSFHSSGDPQWNRPLIEFPPVEMFPPPGDSISAKCEVDSPVERIFLTPSSRKSPPS